MPEFPHFYLPNHGHPEDYTSTNRGGRKFEAPPRDRVQHANKLLNELHQARDTADAELNKTPATSDLHHIPLVFEGATDSNLKVESLEDKRRGIRVVNVTVQNGLKVATVAVPKGKIDHFEKRILDYAALDTAKGKPQHEKLITPISAIRLAVLADYYTDADGKLPRQEEELWWEVWLNTASVKNAVELFRDEGKKQGLLVSDNTVIFPEVGVVLARASLDRWAQFPALLNILAELRRASIVASEYTDLPPSDQSEFIDNLLSRTKFASTTAPAVCLLDTGVNRGHKLLAPALSDDDTQSWKPQWNSDDRKGHGTELAGLALYGPLEELLLGDSEVTLSHRLESVKILPDVGQNEAPDYGAITEGSMYMAEAQAPSRPRTFCLATTADDRDQGLPTLWSAAIDQACAGVGEEDETRRLLVVSAGNLYLEVGVNYPDANHLASVQNPAQSWNSLTVGACTEKCWIQEKGLEGFTPIASKGLLNPASTTSIGWEAQEWPIKPDVVFEGGNHACDNTGFVTKPDDLGLLTTILEKDGALLGVSGDTSAATAQVARMAAILQAEYPHFQPETIKGLLVHSAEWTPEMLEQFPRKDRNLRLRCYGWGIPHLERAQKCATNIATIVIEDSLSPFRKDGSEIKSHEMKLHALPFPSQVLQDLGEEEVSMRVTLSYFIEPSPGRKGWGVRHRYASHGLRFDVIRPEEDMNQFRKRITRTVWEDPKQNPGGAIADSRNWELGDNLQKKGCIHSDRWTGTAATLASCGQIAVMPVTGWWRERPSQNRFESEARYSLLVSIATKNSEIPLYNAVAQEITTEVPVTTDVEI
ncbi:MAG: S8 family peptidase [Planctomycetaceae bacterium]|nr:S8 family peptidase [Planctomycetaceae bacterium]